MGAPLVSGDDEPAAQINTTPLVDVMLVLLIVFLITMPVVARSPVSLPRETTRAVDETPATVTITLYADGRVALPGWESTDPATLTERLRGLRPDTPIHVRADERTRFAVVDAALAAARRAGFPKVGIVTDPTPREARP